MMLKKFEIFYVSFCTVIEYMYDKIDIGCIVPDRTIAGPAGLVRLLGIRGGPDGIASYH